MFLFNLEFRRDTPPALPTLSLYPLFCFAFLPLSISDLLEITLTAIHFSWAFVFYYLRLLYAIIICSMPCKIVGVIVMRGTRQGPFSDPPPILPHFAVSGWAEGLVVKLLLPVAHNANARELQLIASYTERQWGVAFTFFFFLVFLQVVSGIRLAGSSFAKNTLG